MKGKCHRVNVRARPAARARAPARPLPINGREADLVGILVHERMPPSEELIAAAAVQRRGEVGGHHPQVVWVPRDQRRRGFVARLEVASLVRNLSGGGGNV